MTIYSVISIYVYNFKLICNNLNYIYFLNNMIYKKKSGFLFVCYSTQHFNMFIIPFRIYKYANINGYNLIIFLM